MTLHTNDKAALAEGIEGHEGDVPHAMDLAPELAVANGERFDPATGELPLRDTVADDCQLLDAMSAALRSIGRERVCPVRELGPKTSMIERELAPRQPEVQLDYDMDM